MNSLCFEISVKQIPHYPQKSRERKKKKKIIVHFLNKVLHYRKNVVEEKFPLVSVNIIHVIKLRQN